MSDPLDDFLDRGFSCEESATLRRNLRERTTRVLLRRRRGKFLALAGALAACFMAGMTTMYFLAPPAPAANETTGTPPVVAATKVEPVPPAEKPPQTATLIEWQARAQPERRVAQLRRAADLYLEEEHDYASALRCYAAALNTGDAQALDFSPHDTWLEMAIKDARRKDKARAN